MRIVGGRWAGQELVSPGGRVRPSAEAVREALMEAVEDDLKGARILDLFAGTGALGLEALSRGAASIDFVENGPGALHSLKANVARFRAVDQCRIFRVDAVEFLTRTSTTTYDIALADPPYTSRLSNHVAQRWLEAPFSRILAVETAADHSLPGKGRRQAIGASDITIYRAEATR